MTKNYSFEFKNDIDCYCDDEEEEEENDESQKEEQSKEEQSEKSIISENSNVSYSKGQEDQNNIGKDKPINNKIISISQNSISQLNKKNISNDLNDSKISQFLKKSDNNITMESYSNEGEYNILLNYIINKDKFSNSIIITENEILINNILDEIIYYNTSRNKKICIIINDIKSSKKIEKYLEGNKFIKPLFLQNIKIGVNKDEYLNFRAQIDINNLFISKHDILYKLLSIGYVKISDFFVMIFDECHLCEGNHHYNLILQEFYFYYINNNKKISLPNIIGFSNSHLKDKALSKSKKKDKNKIKIGEILRSMSENLNCQIIIDPNIFNVDKERKNRGKVEYVKVDNYLRDRNKVEAINIVLIKYFFEDMINLCIKDYIKFNGETEEIKGDKKNEIKKRYLNLIREKFFSENLEQYTNFENSERNLHFFTHNSFLFKAFEDMQRHLINIIQNADLEEIHKFFENYKNFYEKNLENLNNNEEYLKKIYKKMIIIFKICEHVFKKLIDKKIEYETDRIKKFKDTLNQIYKQNANTKMIILVPNRKIVNVLSSYLNSDKIDNKFKNKSKYIVGSNHKKEQNTSLILALRTTDFEIKERIKQYNEGKISILICTPPALEYLSSIKSDTIIFFSEFPYINNYYEKIKSKLFNCDSKIIILSNNSEKLLIEEENNELKNFFTEGEKLRICVDLRDKNFIKNRNDKKIKYYYISETESKISVKNCMMLFNEIKNLFRSKGVEISDIATTKKYDKDEQKFICNLSICCKELNENDLQFTSGLYNNKQNAMNECYMQYLIFLHQKRIIDNNLQIFM